MMKVLPQSSLWPFLGHLSDIRLEKQRGPEGCLCHRWLGQGSKIPLKRLCLTPFSPGSIVAGLLPSREPASTTFLCFVGFVLGFVFLHLLIKAIRKNKQAIRRQIYTNGKKAGSYFLVFIHVSTLTQDRSNWQWCFHLMFPSHTCIFHVKLNEDEDWDSSVGVLLR